MPQSASIAELAKALCQAQAEMKPAKKESENPFFKSHYADLASVWEAIRIPFSKHGLSVVQLPTTGDRMVGLTTMLMHASGEWVSGDLTMKPMKDDPQSIGSCLTYARRYALSAITGVATEDDDANAATQPAEKALPAFRTVTPSAPAPISDVPSEGQFVWRLGKHKGKPIDEVPLDYLQWFAMEGKAGDHKEAAQKAVDWANSQTALPESDEALEVDQ